MLSQQYFDLRDDTGCIDFLAFRCASCGEVIDPVILKSRVSVRPDLTHGTKERKFMQRLSFGGPLRQEVDRTTDPDEAASEDEE